MTASAAYFQKQNVKISNGEIDGTVIELGTIGFTNGCVDLLYETPWFPRQAHDNVYDFPLINKTVLDLSLHEWSKPKGCRELILECRKLGDELDPNQYGTSPKVNKACVEATKFCSAYLVVGPLNPPYSIPSVGEVGCSSSFVARQQRLTHSQSAACSTWHT